MSDGIYVALSGAIAHATMLDTTAANLANASTAGYQRQRAVFREALSTARGPSAGRFTRVAGVALDGTQGAARTTGRALDLTLPAGSFLAVSTPRGERYTRVGALSVGADGVLRTGTGHAVLDEQGRMVSGRGDPSSWTVTRDGEVQLSGETLTRLRVVRFTNAANLTQEGAGLLAATRNSGAARLARPDLQVGALEDSNTSVVGAMTDLVSATRTFEAFQRVIDAFREADRRVVTSVPNGAS